MQGPFSLAKLPSRPQQKRGTTPIAPPAAAQASLQLAYFYPLPRIAHNYYRPAAELDENKSYLQQQSERISCSDQATKSDSQRYVLRSGREGRLKPYRGRHGSANSETVSSPGCFILKIATRTLKSIHDTAIQINTAVR